MSGLNNSFNRSAKIAAALSLGLASVAVADEAFVGSVLDCRSLPSADARLECYDSTVDGYSERSAEPAPAAAPVAAAAAAPVVAATAEPAAPPVAAPAAEPPAAQTAAPAAAAPVAADNKSPASSEDAFGLPPAAYISDEVDEIEATITELSKSSSGKFTITLDNGQVWRQTSTSTLRLSEGDTVEIQRGSLGSFKLTKAGTKRSMKVKRVK